MTIPHRDLDVRPILRDGGEPFSAIMEAVAELAPGQSLRLLASFKPVPLFQVLGARGFEPVAREIGGGDWEVVFTPVAATAPVAESSDPAGHRPGDDWQLPVREIDCRELDPPEPMVKTLEGVEALAAGETLSALLPREPLFLFRELEARGHAWRGGFEPEGHYRVVIRAGSSGGRQS
jgi:uncharacterized protein (DUF2249 family)